MSDYDLRAHDDAVAAAEPPPPARVTIAALDVPIGDLTIFMIKLAIAFIPIAIFVGVVAAIVAVALMGARLR